MSGFPVYAFIYVMALHDGEANVSAEAVSGFSKPVYITDAIQAVHACRRTQRCDRIQIKPISSKWNVVNTEPALSHGICSSLLTETSFTLGLTARSSARKAQRPHSMEPMRWNASLEDNGHAEPQRVKKHRRHGCSSSKLFCLDHGTSWD